MTWHEVSIPTFAILWLANPTNNYKAQKALRELKSKISSQSKKNFVLEKDVRYLDSRIALLIQNRMALEEVCVILQHNLDTTH
jgi:cell division protein FtsL